LLPPLAPQRRDSILRKGRHAAAGEIFDHEVDPEASPFALPPIEGLPFDRDSEEAVAIRRIEEADRERSRKDARSAQPAIQPSVTSGA
jgi:hypothetical protein